MPDGTSDAVDGIALEGPAASWLEARADELGIGEDELLNRLLAAHRQLEEQDTEVEALVTESDLEDVESSLEDDVAGVADDVEAAESTFEDKLEDVRQRVIQIKRETDQKASTDHDHPDVEERLETTAKALKDLEARHDDLAANVEELQERVDAGFENFEEVLSYLRDETDALDRKTTTLASAVLSLRESVASLAAAEAHRERAEQLKREANLSGVQTADCADCGQAVTVAQLAAPECPFCGAVFEGVDPKSSWFGSNTLLTGSKPALEAGETWLEAESDTWLETDAETLEEMAEIAEDEDD